MRYYNALEKRLDEEMCVLHSSFQQCTMLLRGMICEVIVGLNSHLVRFSQIFALKLYVNFTN